MNEAEVRALLAIPDEAPVAGSILEALQSVPVPGNAAEIAQACMAALAAAGMLGTLPPAGGSPARPARRRY